MKNSTLILFFCLFGLLIPTLISAQNADNIEWLWMSHAKFKPGKSKEALQIGKKYFSAAYQSAGYEVDIYEFLNSEWDVLIVIPLKEGVESFVNMPPKEVGEKLIQLAGGELKLKEITEKYNDLVAKERWDLVKRTSN